MGRVNHKYEFPMLLSLKPILTAVRFSHWINYMLGIRSSLNRPTGVRRLYS